MVLFIEHKNDTWIAKPDRPFGKLQLELYDEAFKINEKDFNVSIERMILEDRTYVSKKSWSKLVEKVESMSLEKMESVATEREEIVKKLLDYALSFTPNAQGVSKAFQLYEEMISFFHFRWNFGKTVEKRLESELEQIPPEYIDTVLGYTENPPHVETIISMKKFEDLRKKVESCPEYAKIFSSLNGELEQVKKIPELWQDIAFLAEEYMHVHNEDMRLPAPYHYIIEKIRKDFGNKLDLDISKKSKPNLDDIRENIMDWNKFERYIRLAVIQGIHRENEHHLQIRVQNRLKRKLNPLGNLLSSKGYLTESGDLYELEKNKVIDLAGKINHEEIQYAG